MANMTMADLLAKQDQKSLHLNRGQEIEGTVVAITDSEFILDLGTKAEGLLHIKDLTTEQAKNLKVGSKISAYVIIPENESGQSILSLHRSVGRGDKSGVQSTRWVKFQDAKERGLVFTGKGLEVNKGGIIVEVNGTRGFLPSSQVALAQAANLDELVGKDLEVSIIEVDQAQNRLIFTQKTKVDEATKAKISALKIGDQVEAKVISVLPFGVFASFGDDFEGLVHSSELSWEKTDNPTDGFKVGDSLNVKIISTDPEAGRINLSVKQLTSDPFEKLMEDFQADDVVKGEVASIDAQGVNVTLKDGVAGFVPANKLDPSVIYTEGQSTNFLVDNVDAAKRRVNLAPFLTSTEGLIYK